MDSPKPNTNRQRKLSVAEAKAKLRAISNDTRTPPTPTNSSAASSASYREAASSGGIGSAVSSSLFESGMALIRRYPKRSIAVVLIGGIVLGRSSHARSAVRWGLRQAMLVRSVTKLLS